MIDQYLISRLFSFPIAFKANPRIIVGQLPEQPISIPLPPLSNVVVSICYGENAFDTLIEVAAPTYRVKAFYHNRLRTMGWEQKPLDLEEEFYSRSNGLLSDSKPDYRQEFAEKIRFDSSTGQITIEFKFTAISNNLTEIYCTVDKTILIPANILSFLLSNCICFDTYSFPEESKTREFSLL